MAVPPARARMLGGIVSGSHFVTLAGLPSLVSRHAAERGWPHVLIYVADLQEAVLSLLTGRGADGGRVTGDLPAELPVDGTAPGRAFQLGVILPTSAKRDQWWVPVLNGAERVGLMRITSPEHDEAAMQDMRELASLVALLLVTKRAASDAYARLVRRRRMNVSAEMEWRLMPPRTFASDRVVISALMEPAFEVSGDAFDYAVSDEVAHLCIFDAMGHDTAAGLTANLAVAACRNARRQGSTLVETAEGVEKALVEQFDYGSYATGILADLDIGTGVLTWLSRGHYPPVVIRGGRYTVPLECVPGPPMGQDLGAAGLCREQLEPGDRLLLYTDGITEARNPEGEEFGLDRFTDFLIRHHADGLPVPETLRRLTRHHLEYHRGRLSDDATVMVLEWHGASPYAPGEAEALIGLPLGGPASVKDRPLR